MSNFAQRIARLSPKKQELLGRLFKQEQLDVSRVIITPRKRSAPVPLSFAQQRLWFLDQLEPDSTAYNIGQTHYFNGPLNLGALERSLSEIVRRHEILRTTFQTVEGEPVQVIAEAQPQQLEVIDLSELPEAEREATAEQMASEETEQPFDLTRGPLFRFRLLRLGEEQHLLLLMMHHIISDGWSLGVLGRELAALYEAYSTGRSSPLAELGIQYADFAVWQREWLQGEVLEKQLAYWREQLGGELPVLELPIDRPRPPRQTYRGKTVTFQLSEPVSRRLKEIGRATDATLFMTLLAAFNAMLWRYTQQQEILIGTPIANRNRAEIEGLIGFFVNTLVLCTRARAEMSFRELLAQVRETALGAYEHQDVPFEKLVEELQPERSLSQQPLFQVLFVLNDATQEELKLAEPEMNPIEGESDATKFDLCLAMEERGRLLSGAFIYNTDLFDTTTIKRMAAQFQLLLDGIAANPEQRLSELPLLTPAEQQLFAEWNQTEREYPEDNCIHELFERQVIRTPDAVAVIFHEARITYHELNCRANQLAHYLQRLGVGPEVQVGILLERSVEMIVGLLAVLKAGGAYVPLDPRYPAERLAFMIADAELKVLITQAGWRERLNGSTVSQVIEIEEEHWRGEETANPHVSVASGNLAYVIYTSGSTGRPKGVAIAHESAVTLLHWARETFASEELQGVLASTSICFDLSVFELFAQLSWGGQVILAENALALPQLAAKEEVRLINTVPSVLSELVRLGELPAAVRVVNLAGEALPRSLVERLYQQETIERVVNLYGPSEDTTYSTCAVLPREEEGRVVIGRPIANTQAHVVDAQGGLVLLGVAGELWLGGEGLARGYLQRAELTAEKFVPDGLSGRSGARLYRTGDLVRYLADGDIDYLGRIDQQVKIRGFRIEPGEIEARLKQHPAVREVVVMAREESNNDRRLVAYVVADTEANLGNETLRDYLREKLPEYMIPSTFVLLDEIPLTPNGKINRQALLAVTKDDEHRAAFAAPRDALELRIARLWEDVLNTRPIGITDNFFERGGHSLLAVRMMAQLSRQIGRELPLALILQKQTVQALATFLRQEVEPQDTSPLIAIQPHGRRLPFFCVHPAGGGIICYSALSRYLGVEQPFYGIQTPGLDGAGQQPPARVESMAARYIEELRTVQSEGPYMIGGWSLGGVIAFEMAQQLRREGLEVSLLALFDSYVPVGPSTEIDDDALLLQFTSDISGLYELEHITDLQSRTTAERLAFLLQEVMRKGCAPPDLNLKQLSRLFEIFRTNVRAMLSYKPGLYPGRITFFRASEQIADISSDPATDWRNVAADGVEVHVVPGDHYTMLREPAVQVMAEWLKVCIELTGTEVETYSL
nr:condensation domain-containing protein [uncultured bacterium]